MSSRRALIALPGALLAGCGFRPLYGPREAGSATAGLETIRVGLIPERNGQLLRRQLEQRLGQGGAQMRYDLRVGLAYGIDLQGFARDGTPSRVRITATANWFLYDTGSPPRLLANGTERAFDAYNVPENQFFSADTSRDATERRLLGQLADDIVLRLALRFEAGPPAAA
ncbi:LPS assembly lipoprotein LptE [Roseomonas rosulenta]|uniref:LPS assembly lipoprotein LptE n=1 Tax=Roseomonas rosulenta TaxID=2748667 RepID=UPI0018DF02F5|nr:LPS assembly lipoprotein LptE [Roseomonas rosulenta]